MSQGSKMHDQYATLFNQIFPRTHSDDSSSTQPHESEQTWLKNILANKQESAKYKWKSVEPIRSGGYVMLFDEVLNMDKKNFKVNR